MHINVKLFVTKSCIFPTFYVCHLIHSLNISVTLCLWRIPTVLVYSLSSPLDSSVWSVCVAESMASSQLSL